MIAMSDGDNSRAPNRGFNIERHTSADTAYANNQTSKVCREARN